MTDHNNSATAAPSPSHELRIRPHHLVCVCFFRGKGYSEEFVANMTETVGRLKAGEPFILTGSTDSICSACPNRKDGGCSAGGRVDRYDARAADAAGLMPGSEYRFPEVLPLIESGIINVPGKLASVCGDCEWFGICGQAAVTRAETPEKGPEEAAKEQIAPEDYSGNRRA